MYKEDEKTFKVYKDLEKKQLSVKYKYRRKFKLYLDDILR